MDVREYFEQEAKRLADQARAITAKADEEGRALSPEDRSQVEGLIGQVTALKGRIQEHDDNENLRKAIDDANMSILGPATVADEPARTIGERFTKSEAYKGLKARGTTGRWTTGPVEVALKVDDGNSNTIQSITDAGGVLPLAPQVLPVVGPVEQKLTVADLFGSGVATQNSIVYLEETSTTAGAHDADPYGGDDLSGTNVTLTDEADLKPVAHIDFTKRSASLDKIAAFLPISDEMLEDEPQIASYITARLPLFVRQAEEAYLLSNLSPGGSADPSDVDGDGSSMFDAIAAGILSVSVEGGLDADAVLINPADYWKMSVTKASGGTGAYFSGGPFSGPASNPWGITAVVTAAVAPGSPIVGAFKAGATVFRKGGLSVEASNSHADYFQRNLTALRAEERLALVVFRPEAFCVVSTTS